MTLEASSTPELNAEESSAKRAKIKRWRTFGLGLLIRLIGLVLIWLGDGSDTTFHKVVVGIGVVLSVGGIAVLRYLLISGFRRKK